MLNKRRLIIATISGVIMGFVCMGLASGGGNLKLPVMLQIVLSRTLIGFSLGICNFKIVHWSLQGILFGIIYSVPIAFSGLMAPENPEFTHTQMFVATIVMGMIYGFLIEVITSVLFKSRAGE